MKAPSTQKKNAREKRGEITPEFERQFEQYSHEELIQLLRNSDAQTRTAAATLLGRRKCLAAVPILCDQLSKEMTLYSRIAFSEALGTIGEPALPELMAVVGKVGHNQHHTLPKGLFKKWNYPLPRDIIVRTIIKIGQAALPPLVEKLDEILEPFVIAEFIDAIGYISYYSGDRHAFEALKTAYETYHDHAVITWKLIRAFQAFPHADTIEYLKEVLLTSHIPQHRWEAARSLGQIGTQHAKQYLKLAVNDHHTLVKEMVQRSLKHIRKNTEKN